MFVRLLLPILFLSFSLGAQSSLITAVTPADGLSHGMVYDIETDRAGFLWMATKYGLNRYDGKDFKIYRHDPYDESSLSGDIITCIYEDKKGGLWLGTANEGLNYLDPVRDKISRLPFHTFSGFQESDNLFVHSIMEDTLGNLWWNAGQTIVRLEKDTEGKLSLDNAEERLRLFPAQEIGSRNEYRRVPSIFSVKDRITVIVRDGIFQYKDEAGEFELLEVPKTESTLFSSIYEESPDRYWVMTPDGIILCQKDTFTNYGYSELLNDFTAAEIRRLAGSFGEGKIRKVNDDYFVFFRSFAKLFRFSFDENSLQLNLTEVIDIDPKINLLTSFTTDQADGIWIASAGYGVYRFNSKRQPFETFFDLNSISSVIADSSGTIFAEGQGDCLKFDPETKQEILGISKLTLHKGLQLEKPGEFWTAGYQKEPRKWTLQKRGYDFQVKETLRFDHHLRGYYGLMLRDKNDRLIVVGYNDKFTLIDTSTGEYEIIDYGKETGISASTFLTYVIYQDEKGDIWLGKDYGLLRLSLDEDYKVKDFSLYQNDPTNRQSLSRNRVLTVAPDPAEPDRYLWLGTKGGGLNKLDKTKGTFEHFSVEQGLPDNVVYGILDDEAGNLWLSTNKGLAKFNPETQQCFTYTVQDGLQEDEFNTNAYFKEPATGKFYFGGINGVTAFYPEDLTEDSYTAPVYLTELKINNRPHQEVLEEAGQVGKAIFTTKSIHLSHSQNTLMFKYAALDYGNSDKTNYFYKLEGAMEDWVDNGNLRDANFTNIAPGEYTFKVKAVSGSGSSEAETFPLQIIISPPWWLSTPAYVLWAILLLALIYGMIRFQVNRLALENDLLFKEKEAERLEELDKIKNDFFSNITHEFRTPLTLILEPVRQMLKEDKSGNFAERLSLVKNNSEKLLVLVNQLLNLSKLENDTIRLDKRLGLMRTYLQKTLKGFEVEAQSKGIELEWTYPGSPPLYYEFDHSKLGQIIGNLLSNALKFTEVGKISLDLQESSEGVLITVKDTGVGIPSEQLPRIFDKFFRVDEKGHLGRPGTGIGLALAKKLTKLMEGEIKVESEPGRGTTFFVKLPLPSVAGKEGYHSEAKVEQTDRAAWAAPRQNAEIQGQEDVLILLVEDNPELRLFIQNSLPAHYHIITAEDGTQGLQKAIEFIPDLIVSDVMMPSKNGYELLADLRKEEKTSHIPVILLTARSSMQSKMQGLNEGADAYLTKPFHTDELNLRIRKLIEMRRLLRQKFTVPGSLAHLEEKSVLSKPDNDFLQRAKELMEENLDDEGLTTDSFAKAMFMSRTQLHRKLKALTDQSATEFIRNYRLDTALKFLQAKEYNVQQAALAVGFKNRTYFSTKFKERFGKSPNEV